MSIESKTARPPACAQSLQVGSHSLRADMVEEHGGHDEGPSPHDLFDASLVACKTLTAHWYAKRSGIPLEAVSAVVERDDSKEREGVYKLTVRLSYQGEMTDQQRTKLHSAVMRCPIHKLMASSEVVIETAPL
jgi:putative redox protein